MLAMNDDKARIEEQVGRALSRGDLRQRIGPSDLDKVIALGAVGITERLADAVFRVKYANDHKEFDTALAGVYGLARAMDARQRWRYRRRRLMWMSKRVLRYWLMDVCQICTGVRYIPAAGTGRLSDVPCPACHAEGKRPMPWVKRLPQEPGKRVTRAERRRWQDVRSTMLAYQERHRALLVALETMERVIGEKMIAKLSQRSA